MYKERSCGYNSPSMYMKTTEDLKVENETSN